MFCSDAQAEGGILGRVDAVYTSIEPQQPTGSLHAHSQVVVQCVHQHDCLSEILQTNFASSLGILLQCVLIIKLM